MSYATGSVVSARSREWVVLPGSSEELLHVKPIGGHESETTAIIPDLETVTPATFDLPDPQQPGNFRSGRLLFDAARLAGRDNATALRAISRINVEPRAYQLVPLLMALRQDVTRLLIADDVGIGKTVEALLIARELLDRGEIQRIAVLCPPALAEQWQREMKEKFHLPAELVLAATAKRLERRVPGGLSLFEHLPITVVSLDYIKSDRRRNEFVRTAPELVIVDEAHTCTPAGGSATQQRYHLVRDLAADPDRHMLLLTATPHSGNVGAFDALIGLIDTSLVEEGSALSSDAARRRLARFFVQRRRPDIQRYLEQDTAFPTRASGELSYTLSAAYRAFLDDVLRFARTRVGRTDADSRERRIAYWSVLSLLRAVSSSPRAAAATLRTRAAVDEAENAGQADEIGRSTVMDLALEDEGDAVDLVAGADTPDSLPSDNDRRRLRELARAAAELEDHDAKRDAALQRVKALLKDGANPILFCRFVDTAHYLGTYLREKLPQTVRVETVTGEIPPDEREERVLSMADAEKCVLVATDCLSEGVNLQDAFQAVVHYDLAWNPTRHEQREGRVDRYGQRATTVYADALYGSDNPVDGMVLKVLLRKHKTIRSTLGIAIPVPVDPNDVLNALLENLILREELTGTSTSTTGQLEFDEFEEDIRRNTATMHQQWDAAAEQEKQLHTRFAQLSTIRPEEVAPIVQDARSVAGDSATVARLLENAVGLYRGTVRAETAGTLTVDPAGLPRALREILGTVPATFSLNGARRGATTLYRTHPVVADLASYVLDDALSGAAIAARSAVIRSTAVSQQTVVAILRVRYDLTQGGGGRRNRTDLVEDILPVAWFPGAPGDAQTQPRLLDQAEAATLFDAPPAGNVPAPLATQRLERIIASISDIIPALNAVADARAEEVARGHQKLREGMRRSTATVTVTAHHPPDILGLYVLLPQTGDEV
jgi:superfamily II DNA or RNA helicase